MASIMNSKIPCFGGSSRVHQAEFLWAMPSVNQVENARRAKQVRRVGLGHDLSFSSGSVDMSIQAVAPEISTTAAEVLGDPFTINIIYAVDRTTWRDGDLSTLALHVWRNLIWSLSGCPENMLTAKGT